MALEHIEYGSLASSELMNNNFEYLDDRISGLAETQDSEAASIYSSIANLSNSFTQENASMASDINDLETNLETLQNAFNAYDITPNYSRAVTVVNSSGSGSYNVTWSGWLAFDLYCNQNSAKFQIDINGVRVGATASDEGDRAAGIVLVKSGNTVSWNGSQSIVIKKVPFVGG